MDGLLWDDRRLANCNRRRRSTAKRWRWDDIEVGVAAPPCIAFPFPNYRRTKRKKKAKEKKKKKQQKMIVIAMPTGINKNLINRLWWSGRPDWIIISGVGAAHPSKRPRYDPPCAHPSLATVTNHIWFTHKNIPPLINSISFFFFLLLLEILRPLWSRMISLKPW